MPEQDHSGESFSVEVRICANDDCEGIVPFVVTPAQRRQAAIRSRAECGTCRTTHVLRADSSHAVDG